jgi:8-oxo-dGTP pyrophosphatase MutT (NUDIX family)
MTATREITPVPSATVTLVRDGGHGLEVLMMERNLQSVFVPGNYVYPGGAVDAQDAAPDASGLCAGLDDARASARLGVASGGLAYWVAAIRESFEEAGLLLAYDPGGGIVEFIRDDVIERFLAHRRAVDEGSCTLAAIVRDEGLRIAADQLVYFSHWITPVGPPRRRKSGSGPGLVAAKRKNRERFAQALAVVRRDGGPARRVPHRLSERALRASLSRLGREDKDRRSQ